MLALRPGSGRERRRIAGQRILLDDDPASIAGRSQGVEDPRDVEVAFADGTEHPPAPDGIGRFVESGDLCDPVEPGVLDVDLVDPAGPAGRGRDRIAAGGEVVTRVEADPDLGRIEQGLDLLRGLDGGPELRMEGRLVPACAAPLERLGDPGDERRSGRPAQGERPIVAGLSGVRGALGRWGVGERRPRRMRFPERCGSIELVEDRVQLVPRAAQARRVAERQLDVPTGERQPVGDEGRSQPFRTTEVADRTEVDAVVAGLRNRRQDRFGGWHAGQADGALEGPVAHGRVRDKDLAINLHVSPHAALTGGGRQRRPALPR